MPTKTTVDEGPILVTQKKLAQLCGVTDRQIRDLETKKGMFTAIQKVNRRKFYIADECVPEYYAHKFNAEERKGLSLDREKEQARHEAIKIKISELKLRKLKRELHDAANVEEFLTDMLVAFKGTLLAIPQKVAPLVVGEDDVNMIIDMLEKEMYGCLEQLSEYDPLAIDKISKSSIDEDDPEEEEEEDDEEE